MNKFMVLLVGLLGTANLSAEYLFWQVSEQVFNEGSGVYDEYAANVYATDPDGRWAAAVRYGTGTDYASWETAMGERSREKIVEGIVGDELGVTEYIDLSAITAYDAMSYYIELYHYNEGGWWEGVARTQTPLSYSQLKSASLVYTGALSGDVTELVDVAVWQGQPYGIPEPTSAMLLMIGLSLVGLKRKRA